MEFEGGCTVSFTMNAFNEGGRFIRIFGTKGEVEASIDSGIIKIFDFATREHKEIDVSNKGNSITEGHGGGDTGIMIDLVKYFNDETPSKSICDINTSFMNHLIAFAAEESRFNDKVVDLDKFAEEI